MGRLTFDGGWGVGGYRHNFVLTLLCSGNVFLRTCVHDIFSPSNLLLFGSVNVCLQWCMHFYFAQNACRISVFKIIRPPRQKSFFLPLGLFMTTLPTFTSSSYGASSVKLPYIHPLGFFFQVVV